jgi:TnpA family transposase
MTPPCYSHEHLVNFAKLSAEDIAEVNRRRRTHNRLGFAYQLVFVRLVNRFPAQQPFEIDDELLTFVSLQLAIPASRIQLYTQRQSTLSGHQEQIRVYLGCV